MFCGLIAPITTLDAAIEIDLVAIESAPAGLRDEIASQGVAL